MIKFKDGPEREKNLDKKLLLIKMGLRFRYGGCLGSFVGGRNSVVECQLPKLDVVGSSPIARSNKMRGLRSFRGPLFVPLVPAFLLSFAETRLAPFILATLSGLLYALVEKLLALHSQSQEVGKTLPVCFFGCGELIVDVL